MRVLSAFLALLLAMPAAGQPTGAELVTSALVRPMGIETDALGRIWVAETGTAQDVDDGQISIVLPSGQVFPFLTGMPSVPFPEGARSVAHLALVGSDLWFTWADAGPLNTHLSRISTAGFTPGDPPRTPGDIAQTVGVGAFLGGQGLTVSNPHGVTGGPDGSIYVVDAAANLLVSYDPAVALLDIRTIFPASPNFAEAVPTGIVAADGRLYVSQLTGFPFAQGIARVFAVELDGTFAVHDEGFTALTDIALDPRAGGALTVLQHGTFAMDPPPPHWQSGTGRAVRLEDDRQLASGFDFATGAAYDAGGLLYVSTLGGSLYRVVSNPVAVDPGPTIGGLVLQSPRPNPSGGATALSFRLAQASDVRLSIYDALGREVAVVMEGERLAGVHASMFDATRLARGAYAVTLRAGVEARTRILLVRR